MKEKRPRVLCVDDEKNVLEGLELNLRRHYEVVTAPGGAQGLEALRERGPFAIVLSDMRMPGMDGAAFLSQVRQIAPQTVRMLLTGQTELAAAITAVNEGQLFRFLTKPCPPLPCSPPSPPPPSSTACSRRSGCCWSRPCAAASRPWWRC